MTVRMVPERRIDERAGPTPAHPRPRAGGALLHRGDAVRLRESGIAGPGGGPHLSGGRVRDDREGRTSKAPGLAVGELVASLHPRPRDAHRPDPGPSRLTSSSRSPSRSDVHPPHFLELLRPDLAEVRLAHQASPLISTSACPSESRMSISRYIAVAVLRCWRARSCLPMRREIFARPAWQWALSGRMPNSSPSARA